MNWGFHFHIPGSRAGAPQDPNDFKEPFRDFHPQSAQFLRWLWCHRYHQNTGCPHTQAWTVSVTTTWATETPGFPVNDPLVGLGNQLLNWMAGQHPPALALPTLTCPCYLHPYVPFCQEAGQESLSRLRADTMNMGAMLMAWHGSSTGTHDTKEFCTGPLRIYIDGGHGWTPARSAISTSPTLHGSCLSPLPDSVSLSTFPFSPQWKAGFTCFGLQSVTHSQKCDLN